MVPKIITHAASVVSQNKKHRVRVLGRETRLKGKRYFPPASLSVSSTNVPATRLERRSRTTQSNRTHGYVAHFRKNDHRLLEQKCSHPQRKRVGICRRDVISILLEFFLPRDVVP